MIILRLIYNEHRDNRRLVDWDILLIKFYESDNRFNGDLFDVRMNRLKQYGYINFIREKSYYLNIEITFSVM